ncbi:serine/threonine-protein phosphatase [Streptomyces griseus]|uniref:SpoIIE family protein phosphatase n=1 Tax=Streptomyces griseus TaxID=1911 RepID=UPI0013BD9340|nr:serine/threonine-protein phosphatase [Streptomyces griseus]
MKKKAADPSAKAVEPSLAPVSYLWRWSRLLPAALLLVGILFQFFMPLSLNGSPFFVASPLIAAPLFSLERTLAFGGAAFAFAATLRFVTEMRGEESVVPSMGPQLTTIAFATAIAALVNIMVRLSSERLSSAHEVAEAAQRAVLPTPSKNVAGLRVAARYQAAQREALIGGDLYGARSTPHGVRLVMGDVRGKGMAAIETVSVVLGAFREASEQEETLSGVARRLEEALVRDRADRDNTDEETFVTCVLVEIPTGHQVVRLLNCGHPAPLLLGEDGSVTPLTPSTFRLPLGLLDLAPSPGRPDTWDFPLDSTLLLYTDGLSETRDATGTFYDPASRLTGRTFPTPARLLSTLVEDVQDFSGGLTEDDMALLAVHRPTPTPATRI